MINTLWVSVWVSESHLVTSNSLQPHGLWPTRLLSPWNSSGKNTGVGCHFLLQGIFLTQGSNLRLLCLLHWQLGSLPLAPPTQSKSERHRGSTSSRAIHLLRSKLPVPRGMQAEATMLPPSWSAMWGILALSSIKTALVPGECTTVSIMLAWTEHLLCSTCPSGPTAL